MACCFRAFNSSKLMTGLGSSTAWISMDFPLFGGHQQPTQPFGHVFTFSLTHHSSPKKGHGKGSRSVKGVVFFFCFFFGQ